MGRVIKGHKYLVAGAFDKLQKDKVLEAAEQLGIEIVGFIFSENTEFIEYLEKKPEPAKLFGLF